MLSRLKNFYHYLIPQIADLYYSHPGKKLIVIGVTGTKGKSTTCRFIASVLQAGGYKVGLMSTVEFQIDKQRILNNRKMSMLGRGQIQKMLSNMVKAGCQYAVIETSSEGILQHRHLGVHYDIAVFTNLGTEHSERHGGFENLKKDKIKLFSLLTKGNNKVIRGERVPKVIIANADDKYAEYFLNFPVDQKFTYAVEKSAAIKGTIVDVKEGKAWFTVAGHDYHLNIIGEFNVPNALAAIAVGTSQGLTNQEIADGLASVKKIEGRMELIEEGQNFKVLVDYAHEPLSLTALFSTLRGMIAPGNKVIGVIGADGGGRDIGKRSLMGEIAGQLCDFVVITDVNCFDEDPIKIAEMLAVGSRQSGKKDGIDLFIEIDRRAGIEKAISLARAGDIVAITAKGTEPCICVARGKKIPWDDRVVAKEVIKALKYL